eukprot:762772-Hanusia_phi.AAC.2
MCAEEQSRGNREEAASKQTRIGRWERQVGAGAGSRPGACERGRGLEMFEVGRRGRVQVARGRGHRKTDQGVGVIEEVNNPLVGNARVLEGERRGGGGRGPHIRDWDSATVPYPCSTPTPPDHMLVPATISFP